MSSRSSSGSKPRPPKRVAIVQSNYIPWKGYFDLIKAVDEFILLDDVQFTRRDWRNRNRIKTPQGTRWLTIPVKVKGRYLQRIDEVEVSDQEWLRSHWATLVQSYSAAPNFELYREPLEDLYRSPGPRRLSDVNRRFIDAISSFLGIRTPISKSGDRPVEGRKSERLVALCRQVGATEYLSGPAARAYLDEELFAEAGVSVSYADYSGYPEYPQLHPPFEHQVTVLDLLFHVGAEAPNYMKALGAERSAREVVHAQ